MAIIKLKTDKLDTPLIEFLSKKYLIVIEFKNEEIIIELFER